MGRGHTKAPPSPHPLAAAVQIARAQPVDACALPSSAATRQILGPLATLEERVSALKAAFPGSRAPTPDGLRCVLWQVPECRGRRGGRAGARGVLGACPPLGRGAFREGAREASQVRSLARPVRAPPEGGSGHRAGTRPWSPVQSPNPGQWDGGGGPALRALGSSRTGEGSLRRARAARGNPGGFCGQQRPCFPARVGAGEEVQPGWAAWGAAWGGVHWLLCGHTGGGGQRLWPRWSPRWKAEGTVFEGRSQTRRPPL